MFNCFSSQAPDTVLNGKMQEAYRKLQATIEKAINADSVTDSLLAAGALNKTDVDSLNDITERSKKMREVLSILHNSEHPTAFIVLHEAIKKVPAYQRVIEEVDVCAGCATPAGVAKVTPQHLYERCN